MDKRRLGVLAAVVVVAVVGFVIASSSDDEKTKEPTAPARGAPTAADAKKEPAPPTIVIKDGKPVGGVRKIDVAKGDRVAFTVRSDVADEIHVHEYDLMKDVEAGGKVRFAFKADIDGEFEVELEHRGEQIAALTVEP